MKYINVDSAFNNRMFFNVTEHRIGNILLLYLCL